MKNQKLFAALLTGLAVALAISSAQAQTWPSKPVTVIVPFAAGGNTDGIARMISQRLSDAFGQPFVVENKGGAGGALAADFVARAQPDGYTMFVTAVPVLAIVPKMMKVRYDPILHFAPISNIASNPFVLVVSTALPINSVAELVAYVRERKGGVSYASAGHGSLTHLSMALFLKQAGIDMNFTYPYKGNAPALSDVIAGDIPAMFSNLSNALPQIASGTVRPLAVSGSKRAAQIPNVPP